MSQFFAVLWRPGPAWVPGLSLFRQPIDDHVEHLRAMARAGKLLMSGPYPDSSGGLTILQNIGEAEARAWLARDPAVQKGILTAELHPWAPIAWDQSLEAALLYEQAPLHIERAQPPVPRPPHSSLPMS